MMQQFIHALFVYHVVVHVRRCEFLILSLLMCMDGLLVAYLVQ
jgi:hypothetical protein